MTRVQLYALRRQTYLPRFNQKSKDGAAIPGDRHDQCELPVQGSWLFRSASDEADGSLRILIFGDAQFSAAV
jgi:hypothetical protein